MYCQHCGSPIDDHAAFCPNCGAPTAAPKNPDQQQTAPPYMNQPAGNQTGYTVPQQTYPAGSQKSKLAAGLLGIFLGSLGVHNFYLGYTGKAVAQLLITLLTCGIGAIGTSIWGLVEGILILTGSMNVDANGVPLGD